MLLNLLKVKQIKDILKLKDEKYMMAIKKKGIMVILSSPSGVR